MDFDYGAQGDRCILPHGVSVYGMPLTSIAEFRAYNMVPFVVPMVILIGASRADVGLGLVRVADLNNDSA